MAGLYVHIPFCRDACAYCDFHFSIYLDQLNPMLDAIIREIEQEKDFLEGEELATIYLGGGTPSVLEPGDIERVLETIKANFTLGKEIEITLEANPDDLEPDYLDALAACGINRLSIGIQSFFDADLERMNRRHTACQAKSCIENALAAGFRNLNLDLMYGLPDQREEQWVLNITTALKYNPAHIAAYHLSYEPGTVLRQRLKKQMIHSVPEEKSLDFFRTLVTIMKNAGYQHYEISNFALPGFISKHNSAYWKGGKYLGVGPSAHSYDGRIRRWNLSKNTTYIRGFKEGINVYEEEILDRDKKFHDYLMTSLRTVWGLDLDYLSSVWPGSYRDHILREAEPFIRNGKMMASGNKLILTTEGMFIADYIIRSLFL
jgi:oxygen-independent coproporphyrinogen-3 oxidase